MSDPDVRSFAELYYRQCVRRAWPQLSDAQIEEAVTELLAISNGKPDLYKEIYTVPHELFEGRC